MESASNWGRNRPNSQSRRPEAQAPIQVLIVEDERLIAQVTAEALRRGGYAVAGICVSGEEALQKVAAKVPDLVLMDIRLEGALDGIETAELIRKRIDRPVIYLTGVADEETLERAKVSQPFGYLLKPFDTKELQIAIEMAIFKHDLERQLRESEERYELAARAANDGLWDWDLTTDMMYFSPRWKSLLGYDESEIRPFPVEWFDRIHPDEVSRVRAELDRHRQGFTEHFECEFRVRHKDGSYRWMLSRAVAVSDEAGKPIRLAGSQSDITVRKQVEQQLQHDAFHDALTGLPNRALLLDRISQSLHQIRRRGNEQCAVLFLDLDNFKTLNDSLGHSAGDQFLVALAEGLTRTIRTEDTVSRLGGDEFALLIRDIHDLQDATRVADRIHELLAKPVSIGRYQIVITGSIGIALGSTGKEHPEDLVRDADIAMYKAKQQGKARSVIFTPDMHEHAMARMNLETDLRLALEREEFKVDYQPIVSLRNDRIVGLEALVRWKHPRLGLLSPSEFLNVAQEAGLITAIDWWVVDEACRQIRRWQSIFPSSPPLMVSVNLSAREYTQADLPNRIQAMLTRHDLSPESLKLEIMETVLMENSVANLARLDLLAGLGTELYLDDFGTGYASLSCLHRFPLAAIKLDRSFMQQMNDPGVESEIVRAMVILAHTLGLKVIAEGIETPDQLAILRSLGCDYGQGYILSEPLDASSVEAWLAMQSWEHSGSDTRTAGQLPFSVASSEEDTGENDGHPHQLP